MKAKISKQHLHDSLKYYVNIDRKLSCFNCFDLSNIVYHRLKLLIEKPYKHLFLMATKKHQAVSVFGMILDVHCNIVITNWSWIRYKGPPLEKHIQPIDSALPIRNQYAIFYSERCTRVYQLHDIDVIKEERIRCLNTQE